MLAKPAPFGTDLIYCNLQGSCILKRKMRTFWKTYNNMLKQKGCPCMIRVVRQGCGLCV